VLINEVLVTHGHAFATAYPPDVAKQSLFETAEEHAQTNQLGLWGNCQLSPPDDCPIKGNISFSGQKIYHLPGQRYYDQTTIDTDRGERYFCTESEAHEAGWEKAKT
jgi:micrococcal nuclease